MARVPELSRENIPEDQRATYDGLIQQRGEVPTTGPGSVMLNAPEVAERALGLALYLRTETSLPPRIRELGMMVAARENDCQFIWHAHAPVGRKAGLKDESVDALRDKKDIPGLEDDEAAVVNYGQEFFRTRKVSKDTFDAALAQFGVLGLTELTNLMGCYSMLAFNVNAFGVELPEDSPEIPLPV
ncbi:MAG: hypothetical protein COA56_13945 [Dehalococcoidia bacterium]|nr:MAG: hypothetical protein COA56_13945 [Dehalococcoidia bacterium]